MKLSTVTATSMFDAMDIAREKFGADVFIVSSLKLPSGEIQLVVATDTQEEDNKLRDILFNHTQSTCEERLKQVLNTHQTPATLITHFIDSIKGNHSEEIAELLTMALGKKLTFETIPMTSVKQSFLFTGTAGSGKTITLAKYAVAATLKGLRVGIISLDTKKAGGIEQLQAFTKLLNINLRVVENKIELPMVIEDELKRNAFVFIDTPAVNPLLATELADLIETKRLAKNTHAIVTMQTGLASKTCGTMASAFAKADCTYLIGTHTGTVPVYGNILYAAFTGNLKIAGFATTNSVTNPVQPLSPKHFADLMIKSGESL